MSLRWCAHPHLRAIIGSSLVARRAGTKLAARATPASITGIAMKVSGSVGLTLYSKLETNLVNASADATPSP